MHSASKKKKYNAIPDDIKLSICNAYKAGVSALNICKAFGVAKTTFYRIYCNYSKFGSFSNNLSNRGRKKKTTEEIDSDILQHSRNNRKLLPRELQKILKEKYGIELSLTQIKVRLRKDGLNGHVCSRKPLLRPINKIKRLIWAVQHQHWTVEQWKRVLWTDEKKFELFNTKRRTYCRKIKGEQFRDDTVQGTVKHGGGSAMYWGAVGNNTCGNLFKIEGIMEKNKYKSILENEAFPSGATVMGDGSWTQGGYFDEKLTSIKKQFVYH
jgi:transposase